MPSKEQKSDIDLTVIMFAYNHAPYIREAIESVLNQKTKYKYEIIITDDGSSDGTAEVIREYESKYPEIIKAYLEEKNCGNPRDIIMKYCAYPKGNYWCLLETDDYWTSDEKIEKQLDFLYANLSYVGANHASLVINKQTGEEYYFRADLEEWDVYISLRDFWISPKRCLYCHTSSWMWKNVFKTPKAWFDLLEDKNTYGDPALSLRLMSYGGKVKYIDEVMSCYRMTGGGDWSKLSEEEKERLNKESAKKAPKAVFFKHKIYYYYALFIHQVKSKLLNYVYKFKMQILPFFTLIKMARKVLGKLKRLIIKYVF